MRIEADEVWQFLNWVVVEPCFGMDSNDELMQVVERKLFDQLCRYVDKTRLIDAVAVARRWKHFAWKQQ